MEIYSEIIQKNTGMKILNWKGYRSFYGDINGSCNFFVISEGNVIGAFKNFDINGYPFHFIVIN